MLNFPITCIKQVSFGILVFIVSDPIIILNLGSALLCTTSDHDMMKKFGN